MIVLFIVHIHVWLTFSNSCISIENTEQYYYYYNELIINQVIESIMELFSLRESDMAWHGGCLALAELGKIVLNVQAYIWLLITNCLPLLHF
jgi:hypothetical protein